MSRPRPCAGCGAKPVAFKRLRFCFHCKPGGPYPEPPCKRCGSSENYFSAGLCSRCHQFAPQPAASCLDCHAWGVKRIHGWLCHSCTAWRRRNPGTAPCIVCRDDLALGDHGACRLCWRVAANAREATKLERPYRPLDVVGSNRDGQQLFFADLGRLRRPRRYRPVATPRRWAIPGRQLGLFDPRPVTWASRRGLPEPPTTERIATLNALVRDHAAGHGWSKNTTKRTRRGVQILVGRQPGGPIVVLASEVVALAQEGFSTAPILTILSAADMLQDDRVPALVTWFESQITGLPATLVDELRVWFKVLRQGSIVPPRTRPRAVVTIRLRTNWAMPILREWAGKGHQSLRSISRADVLLVLPASGNPRATAGSALRSIFGTLKAHKILFTNPMARIAIGAIERRQPMPLDVEQLRAAIDADDPARAALGALLAFHGLRPEQLRGLRLTDVRDGRVHLEHGTVLLAGAARQKIGEWLDYRNRRWPNTANPHLFIHYRTATGIGPIGHTWIGRRLGIAAGAIRDDRILDEVNATGGDIRRICDLFGLSVNAAVRYVATLDSPALVGPPDRAS